MVAVNGNIFDASVAARPQGGLSIPALPLNLIAVIVSYACIFFLLDDVADLARLCQTCRVLNYMALPHLYKNLVLTSYDKIRYRDDRPEGWGSASPFSMGLNAVVTGSHACLVQSLALQGEWREHDLEEHARVGRVPDSSMMLNITVRAAIDRMSNLESFSWELGTKILETVYLGLSRLPKLTSLTLRFPSSRHPRPTAIVPPMPHLRSLKVTNIDPLCYPDDISTMLLRSKNLRELNMHWSPRMREAQEPSVMLHDYFRKCVAAKSPLKIRKLGLQNFYALHREEINDAFDPDLLEDITMLSSPSSDSGCLMDSFVENSWSAHNRYPDKPRFKAMRQDFFEKHHCESLSRMTGLERLYFVNPIRGPGDQLNNAKQSAGPSSMTLTPPLTENFSITTNTSVVSSPNSQSSYSNSHLLLRDSYLNVIVANHGATLRHLLLPSRWPLSANLIARLVHACPNLEQLALAPEVSAFETLALLFPFLRNLRALRVLLPTSASLMQTGTRECRHDKSPCTQPAFLSPGIGTVPPRNSSCPITIADMVHLDDHVCNERLSINLANKDVYSKLQLLGLGWKSWILGDFYTISSAEADQATSNSVVRGHAVNGNEESGPGIPGNSYPNTITTVNSRIQIELATNSKSPPNKGTNSIGLPISQGLGSPATQPRSSLGKHPRETTSTPFSEEQQFQHLNSIAVGTSNIGSYEDVEAMPYGENLVWRRRVRRVDWEVLKHWEIWGLDSQDL